MSDSATIAMVAGSAAATMIMHGISAQISSANPLTCRVSHLRFNFCCEHVQLLDPRRVRRARFCSFNTATTMQLW